MLRFMWRSRRRERATKSRSAHTIGEMRFRALSPLADVSDDGKSDTLEFDVDLASPEVSAGALVARLRPHFNPGSAGIFLLVHQSAWKVLCFLCFERSWSFGVTLDRRSHLLGITLTISGLRVRTKSVQSCRSSLCVVQREV